MKLENSSIYEKISSKVTMVKTNFFVSDYGTTSHMNKFALRVLIGL